MPQPRIDMQYVLDRTAIEEVIARYYQGLDRALRDQVRSANGEWRISVRRHTLDWSCELQPDFAVALAQRITTWP